MSGQKVWTLAGVCVKSPIRLAAAAASQKDNPKFKSLAFCHPPTYKPQYSTAADVSLIHEARDLIRSLENREF